MNRSLLIVVGIVLWLVGCKPGTPSEYIQPDEMEDILVDYHMAKAMAEHADEALAMVDEHRAAIEEVITDQNDLAVCWRFDRRAGGHRRAAVSADRAGL